jgi:hypothetical protein
MNRTVREALWNRAGGRCEVTGVPVGYEEFDAHHRRNKGMGGTSRPDRDWLSNLLCTDPQVHNGGPRSIHARRPWSESNGFLIPKHIEWAITVPIRLHLKHLVYLGDDGQYYPAVA